MQIIFAKTYKRRKRSFWSLPVTFGWAFMHQRIVSSLFYNILEAQRCSFNHMLTPDEMKKDS